MNPDRGFLKGSVCSASIGVSMMRMPKGSMPAFSPSAGRINPPPPPTKVIFGIMSVSTTLK